MTRIIAIGIGNTLQEFEVKDCIVDEFESVYHRDYHDVRDALDSLLEEEEITQEEFDFTMKYFDDHIEQFPQDKIIPNWAYLDIIDGAKGILEHQDPIRNAKMILEATNGVKNEQ